MTDQTLNKSDRKEMYNVTKYSFIKESLGKITYITVCTKILSSTTVFNIDDKNKHFLSSKTAY